MKTRTKIKTESEFIVKPEDRLVVCKMRVDMQIFDFEFWRFIDSDWWYSKAPIVDNLGHFTVTAKAKCSTDDIFSESKGKRIAESKAKAKAFKISSNVWDCITKGITEYAKVAGTFASNCAAMEAIEIEHVKELSK